MNPYIQRARMLYQRSRIADAERELGMALEFDPEEPWAYALLGACRAAQEDFSKAEELGQRAVSLAPDSAEIRYLLSRIQLARNDLASALGTINQAIQLDPQNADFYATRARVHGRQKAWDKALADCDLALSLEAENVEAINIRSVVWRAKGDGQSSAAELQRGLRLAPDDPDLHANLGWNHLQRGELADAERHFREALRLDPDLESARVGVLETIKAKVPFYRYVLNYFLWMQTKASGAQWAIIIGLYVAYRLMRSVAANNPALAPFLMPFVIVYLLFVLATWFAKPLADTALLLHPFGRLALTRQERREGVVVTVLVATVVGLIIAHTIAGGHSPYFIHAWLIGAPGLPLAMSYKFEARRPRRILQAVAGVLCLVSLMLLIDIWTPIWSNLIPPDVHLSIMSLLVQLLLLSVLGTLIGTNLLASVQWRR